MGDWLKAGLALTQFLVLLLQLARTKRDEGVGAGKALAWAIEVLTHAADQMVANAARIRADSLRRNADPSELRRDDGFKRKPPPPSS